MPVDLTDAILFMLFLGLFVLFGTTPVLPRLFAFFGKLLRKRLRLPEAESGPSQSAEGRPQAWRGGELNDYEIILLRKLVMTGSKGLSRRGLINALYFKPESVDQALETLHRRGLIQARKGTLFGVRFRLSVAGMEYASRQDMVPRYLLSNTKKSGLSLLG